MSTGGVEPVGPPLPLPLRVLVKGPSSVVWTSYPRGPRTDFAYPRVIEEALLRAGQVAEVRTTATAGEPTRQAFKTWESEVIAWSPDVVVLHYPHYETLHLILPHWFERYCNSLRVHPGPIRSVYRRRVVDPLYQLGAKLQQALDRTAPPSAHDRRRARVEADLQFLIRKIRSVASPLVIVAEITRPGPPFREWFPGMEARVVAINELADRVVASFDHPDVRRFPTNAVASAAVAEGEEIAPDGGHYTPTVHRAIGEGLAAEILAWAATQPHLRPGG